MNVLKLTAVAAVVAGLTACGAETAAVPQPTVTTTVTPKPVAPSRIVTLEDIIQGCADAMVKNKQVELYATRPKACAQLGEPEFSKAANLAIVALGEQFATEAP